MLLTSYHTHTNWSDGLATLPQMLAGARQAGLAEIGISDHYVLMPGGHQEDWSMPPDFLATYVATLTETAAGMPALRVGIEADFLPETINTLTERLARYPFDYIIGSVHIVDTFHVDVTTADWEPLAPEEITAVWRLYWQRIREMVSHRWCDFVGHLDLPKKFGFYPPYDYRPDALATLDAIADARLAIELNTAGWEKPAAEAYPSEFLLREARKREIPLVITADAHHPRDLTRYYDRAATLAAAAGYTSVVTYRQRERKAVAL